MSGTISDLITAAIAGAEQDEAEVSYEQEKVAHQEIDFDLEDAEKVASALEPMLALSLLLKKLWGKRITQLYPLMKLLSTMILQSGIVSLTLFWVSTSPTLKERTFILKRLIKGQLKSQVTLKRKNS